MGGQRRKFFVPTVIDLQKFPLQRKSLEYHKFIHKPIYTTNSTLLFSSSQHTKKDTRAEEGGLACGSLVPNSPETEIPGLSVSLSPVQGSQKAL